MIEKKKTDLSSYSTFHDLKLFPQCNCKVWQLYITLALERSQWRRNWTCSLDFSKQQGTVDLNTQISLDINFPQDFSIYCINPNNSHSNNADRTNPNNNNCNNVNAKTNNTNNNIIPYNTKKTLIMSMMLTTVTMPTTAISRANNNFEKLKITLTWAFVM
ncbi:ras-related protein RabV-like [Heterodontus francisci]|uniref:ras-related protein RabV-like n=1 Tax=Heterodontus francisci TaxID=7792 RepID=UPI00355B2F2A